MRFGTASAQTEALPKPMPSTHPAAAVALLLLATRVDGWTPASPDPAFYNGVDLSYVPQAESGS